MIYNICRDIKGHRYYVRFNSNGMPMYLLNKDLAAKYPSINSASYLVSRWPSLNLYIIEGEGDINEVEFLALYGTSVIARGRTINELKDKICNFGFNLSEVYIAMEV